MTAIEFLRSKRPQILEIAAKHGVTRISVFGSVVRGEESPDSDVDLLVGVGPKTSSWFPAGLVMDLESLLGRRVEVVTETGLNTYLRDRVLREAVQL